MKRVPEESFDGRAEVGPDNAGYLKSI